MRASPASIFVRPGAPSVSALIRYRHAPTVPERTTPSPSFSRTEMVPPFPSGTPTLRRSRAMFSANFARSAFVFFSLPIETIAERLKAAPPLTNCTAEMW
eukprot:COSAG04_NODE_2150_length_4685_cov_7.818975_2_plen_100_part_00